MDFKFRHPAEARAAELLQSRGHRLVRHNLHLGFMEIDLITFEPKKELIHFVEVKFWKPGPVHPLERLRPLHLYRKAMRIFQFRCISEIFPGEPEFDFTLDLLSLDEKGRGTIYPDLLSF